MARRGSDYADEDGDKPDWIELYNPGGEPYDLRGHHLTDDLDSPEKWRFPAVTLAPRGYLVVFASGKDRRAPGAPLHTGFRLSGDGETVALTAPDGAVLHAFEDWPAQVPGVSYGSPMRIGRTPVLTPGAPARLHVGPPPPRAMLPDFDDREWQAVRQGVGFDHRPAPRAEVLITDSVAAFSGVQGQGGWTYGAWEGPGPYAPDAFAPLPPQSWDGEGWRSGVVHGASGGRPTARRWAVRRFTTANAGTARITGRLENPAAAGDGVVARIFVDGEEVFQRAVDGRGLDYRVDVVLRAATTLDFALDAADDEDGDDTIFTARVVSPSVGTDTLGARLADTAADWTGTDQQGARGWTYGRYVGGAFEAFDDDAWTGVAWTDGVTVERDEASSEAGAWATRRWRGTAEGPVLVRWRIAKAAPGEDGVAGIVMHRGEEIDRLTLAGDDLVGARAEVVIPDLAPGDAVDLVLSAEGAGAAATMHASVHAITRFADFVETDLTETLGLASDFWLRVPFSVPPGLGAAELELVYDDGLTVWVDGLEVHRDNAEPGAASDRSDSRAVGRVRVPLADRGVRRVLALHVVNSAAPDDVFFAQATVSVVGLEIEARPRYLVVPTPGADNIFGAVDQPPIIVSVDRHQAVGVADEIPIDAHVLPGRSPLGEVTLTYRVMFDDEVRVPMALEGDRWHATLPAGVAAPGHMVRWFVEATDADGLTSRYPPFLDPTGSERYVGTMVDDPSTRSNLPIYHWFVAEPEQARTPAGARGALFVDGELYDNIRVDLHGQATRRFPKNSYNFDFNRDHRFRIREGLERVKDFDLLTNYADKSKMRNTLAYGMFRDSGHGYHLTFPVRVQQNGAFFAVYEFVEDPDERWLRRLGHSEPLGAIYKVYDNLSSANRSEKKSRELEDNTDLAAFIAGLGAPGEARRLFIYDHVDLPRMANFLAMLFITAGMDCCHKNYYAFHDLHTDRWWYLPWDIDLSLGRNWTGHYFDDRMFPRNPLFRGGGNRLISPLYEMPEFVEMYVRRVRTLADEQMQRGATPYAERYLENAADELLARIGADAVLDNEAWGLWGVPRTQAEAVRVMKEEWLVPRRAFIYGELAQTPGGPVRTLLDGRPGVVTGRWLVPTDDRLGDAWTRPGFDDDGWSQGPMGVGYEDSGADYAPFIRSVVRPTDVNPAATNVLLRVRFEVDAPGTEQLVLRMRYDDGYVAWLNGVEVARRNVGPGPVSWRGGAAVHDDAAATRFEDVDIQRFADALVGGTNVLAVRVVNTDAASSDLLLLPGLVDGVPAQGGGPLPPAQAADVQVAVESVEPSVGAPSEAYAVLLNEEPTAVDLSGWSLSGRGVAHVFAGGTVIPSGGRLYVVANAPAFRDRIEGPRGGQGLLVVGNWRGTLEPAGMLRLERPE